MADFLITGVSEPRRSLKVKFDDGVEQFLSWDNHSLSDPEALKASLSAYGDAYMAGKAQEAAKAAVPKVAIAVSALFGVKQVVEVKVEEEVLAEPV